MTTRKECVEDSIRDIRVDDELSILSERDPIDHGLD